MKDKKKADLIPFDGGGNVDEMKDAIRKMKKMLPEWIEYHQIAAKIQKAKFDALLEEGFSEAQAIELCKGIPG